MQSNELLKPLASTSNGKDLWLEFLVTIFYSIAVCGGIVSSTQMTSEVLTAPSLLVVALSHGLSYAALLTITSMTGNGSSYMNPVLASALVDGNRAWVGLREEKGRAWGGSCRGSFDYRPAGAGS